LYLGLRFFVKKIKNDYKTDVFWQFKILKKFALSKKFNSDLGTFGNGERNVIKLFDLNGQTINIKSFKVPNIVNKVAYKYF
jgi:hypothetical protein